MDEKSLRCEGVGVGRALAMSMTVVTELRICTAMKVLRRWSAKITTMLRSVNVCTSEGGWKP